MLWQTRNNSNSLSGFAVTASVQLFVLQCFSLVLGFLLNYILVKTVPVAVYGEYVSVFNLLYLLLNFCLFGVEPLLVKMTAVYNQPQHVAKQKGLLFFSLLVTIVGCFCVALLSKNLLFLFQHVNDFVSANWYSIALPFFLVVTVTTVSQAFLQGLKKNIQSQVAEKVVRPILFILAIVLLSIQRIPLTVQTLITLGLVAVGVTALLSVFFLLQNVRRAYHKAKPVYLWQQWLPSAATFFAMSILYAINARVDILLLAYFKGPESVGVYNVVLKWSELLSFVLMIVNFVLAPLAATLYNTGNQAQLQKLITRAAQAVLILSLPLFFGFILFRKPLLLIFGVSFLKGEAAFVILCFGQLLNVLFGSVGTLLLMSGNQRFSVLSLCVSLLCNILFNLFLTPQYGIAGTATATAASLAIWNAVMYFFVRTKMKLRTTAFEIA